MSDITVIGNLKAEWESFKKENPKVRIRDAASQMGVSEAELVATGCGEHVVRLKPDWFDLLLDLEGLGEVMALTRNEVFVHEKVGTYANASVMRDHKMGQVLDKNIDLRIFFRNWHVGYAVENELGDQVKRSLQFFNAFGEAVHKVHLRPASNVDYYNALVEKYRSDNQEPKEVGILQEKEKPEVIADAEIDATVDSAALRKEWDELGDTHNFIFMLRKFKVNRQQAFRIAGTEYALPVPPSSFRACLEGASKSELPIMIFVRNSGCVQIHTGPVKRLKEARGWYNVLDPGFNLHVKDSLIKSAWVVRKPVDKGWVHSLELYDEAGEALCYIFGLRKEGQDELTGWRALINDLGA